MERPKKENFKVEFNKGETELCSVTKQYSRAQDEYIDYLEEMNTPSKIKEMNVTETPERWVILKLPNNQYKVFGTWSESYLNGDSWKLNSGISEVEQDNYYYYFIGFSGSCYRCHKKRYGTASNYGLNVLSGMVKQSNGQLELMEDSEDWEDILTS